MSVRVEPVGGGITAPRGFRTAGVWCGIKASKKLDFALIVADGPASAAGVFTTNKATAAPVLLSRAHLEATGGTARAVVVNSGCANACTGADGMQVAREMAVATATAVGCAPNEVLVASTGVIGVALDIAKVRQGVTAARAALSADANAAAAQAIMTTDPFPKEYAVRVTGPAGTFTVGGMAKGSGMIEPMMATMLGFLTTDAAVPAPMLRRALVEAVNVTFNAITVDGEPSTNDSVFVLASGASGVQVDEAGYAALLEGLQAVCLELALGIVRGGEGATKLVTVRVTGGATTADAFRTAKAIGNSPLVKTAIHGGDPNWGRLIAVAGRAGVPFELDRARVVIGDVVLFADGRPYDERAPQAADYLRGKDIHVQVDLGTGGAGEATIWTCDFSAEYVRINADYRT